MSVLQELTKVGNDLGLKGIELQEFVKEQQTIARNEREKERAFEKEKAEIAAKTELEKAGLNHAKGMAIIEKQRLEITEKGKIDAAEIDLKKKTTEQLEYEMAKEGSVHETEGNHGEDRYRAGRRTGSKPREPKLSPYDDIDDIDSYLQRFEQYASLEEWPKDTWAIYLAALLKGKALDVYTRLPTQDAGSYKALRDILLKRYEKTEEGYRKLFYSARCETGEGQHQFMVRLARYLLKYVELSKIEQDFESVLELLVREQYLATCTKELEIFLRERPEKDMTKLAKNAELFIAAHKSKGYFETESRQNKREVKEDQRESQSVDKKERSPKKTGFSFDGKHKCYVCGKTNHIAKDCLRSQIKLWL